MDLASLARAGASNGRSMPGLGDGRRRQRTRLSGDGSRGRDGNRSREGEEYADWICAQRGWRPDDRAAGTVAVAAGTAAVAERTADTAETVPR